MAYTRFLATAGVAAMLAACGGDSSSGTKDPELAEGSDIVAETFDDLPVCSDKLEGATAYVKDEKTAYVCEDGDWTNDDDSGKDPEPAEGSSSSGDGGSETTSSSVKGQSSSSVIPGSDPESSSSVSEAMQSTSSETGWSWDVPKEVRLNSEITYGTMTDSRDNKKYKTVTIGGQTWMAENLNYADSAKTPSLKGKSWCFGNDSLKCKVAGRLYTWAAAIDSVKLATDADNPQDCGVGKTCTMPAKVQGVCPPNWHLPTYAEWETLISEVGGSSTAGKVLKSQSGWFRNGNGSDAFGFSALPAGGRCDGHFISDGNGADFWSASEYDDYNAYSMYLRYSYESAHLDGDSKVYAFSVRCVENSK